MHINCSLSGHNLALRIQPLLQLYRKLIKSFKPCILVSHLSLVLNQWCTRRRFGSESVACPFGCGHHNDDIDHLISCPEFTQLFNRVLRCRNLVFSHWNILLLNFGDSPHSSFFAEYVFLFVHVCRAAHNSLRHGGTFNRRLVTHLLKRIATHCNKARKFIVFCRATDNYPWPLHDA